jgi:hypothetical protein
MRKAIMALEGLEEVVDTPVEAAEVSDARVEEIEQSPEQDIQAMTSDEAEIDSISDSVDESTETAEVLTDIQDKMGETLEDGGMDEKSAEVVRVAVEHLCKRVGFSANRASFSMEGFKSKASRVSATKIAMEELGEKIKKIYEAIVAVIKKVIESIKTFFVNLFNVAKKNKSRAETLLAASKNAKNVTPSKVKISNILTLNGQYIKAGELASALTTNHKAIDSELLAALGSGVKIKELSRKVIDICKNILNFGDDAALNKEFGEACELIYSGWGKETTEGDKITIISNTTFIGDKQYKVELSPKFYKPNFFGFVDTANKAKAKDEEVDSLDASQAGAVSSEIIKIMSDFLLYEKQIKDVNDASFGFTETVKNFWNAKDSTMPSNTMANLQTVMMATSGIVRLVNITMTKARSYEMSVAGAALDYVAKSIKGGKEEKAPEAKDEDKKLEIAAA